MPDGKYQVRYHSLFHTDVVSAANWYDRHKVGLGVKFLESVETAPSNWQQIPIGVLLLITVCGTGRFPDFHSSSSTTFESLRFLFLV